MQDTTSHIKQKEKAVAGSIGSGKMTQLEEQRFQALKSRIFSVAGLLLVGSWISWAIITEPIFMEKVLASGFIIFSLLLLKEAETSANESNPPEKP